MIRWGKVDAYAAPRVMLLGLSKQTPGSRVFGEWICRHRLGSNDPKGNAERIAYLNDFLKEAKTSGLVQQIIDRYG